MLDEMAVYSPLEEQDANGDRFKTTIAIIVIVAASIGIGFLAGIAVAEPEEAPARVCALSGSSMFPVCKTEDAS